MLESALSILEKRAKGKRLAVAVSGGRDSVCLLHLIASCGFIDKASVTVINVEHGIRGDESVRDSLFTAQFTERLGFAADCRTVNVPERAARSGRSLETEARICRREIFAEYLNFDKADYIVTAHHASDNAESVLMHILRGSGLSGLVGIKEEGDGFLRPLVYTTRSEIDEYICANGLSFTEDSTNADESPDRNFLRLKVMPLLESRWKVVSAVGRLSYLAAADEDYFALETNKGVALAFGEARISDKLSRAHYSLFSRAVIRAARLMGVSEDIEQKHIAEALAVARARTGASADLPRALRVVKDADGIALYRKEAKDETIYPFKEGRFELAGSALIIERIPQPDDLKGGGALYISEASVPVGTVIRTRRNGDKFAPFGGGQGKLKEYLIDKKIPARFRDKIPLVCYNDRVIAAGALAVSRLASVQTGEKSVYKITVYGEIPWKS